MHAPAHVCVINFPKQFQAFVFILRVITHTHTHTQILIFCLLVKRNLSEVYGFKDWLVSQ